MSSKVTLPRQLHGSRLAALAIVVVATLVALILSPTTTTPRIGDPGAGFWNVPASEAPVPDRPERPELPAAAAIVRAERAPSAQAAIALEPFVEGDGARDGYRPRVERPPST